MRLHMQQLSLLKAKVSALYENNMKKRFDVQICRCADVRILDVVKIIITS